MKAVIQCCYASMPQQKYAIRFKNCFAVLDEVFKYIKKEVFLIQYSLLQSYKEKNYIVLMKLLMKLKMNFFNN